MFFAFTAFLLTASVVYAASGRYLGGHILNTQAQSIIEAEAEGYKCELNRGKTLQIKTQSGASEGYYIPADIRSATRKEIRSSQQILGVRSIYVKIICTKKDKDGNSSKKIVPLRKITYYGT